MAITFNGTHPFGQKLGDTLVSIKVAWLMARRHPCDRYLLGLSRRGEMNLYWQKFIDHFKAEVVYDDLDPGNDTARFEYWDECRRTRELGGIKFDLYRELYRRIDGGHRQARICGREVGLGQKNIFAYFLAGQEEPCLPCPGDEEFGPDLIYHDPQPSLYDVFISPEAICQGNREFTFEFWDKVVRKLVSRGVSVTVNHRGEFAEDLKSDGLYRRIFPPFQELRDEVCRHRLVCCGNTGVMWLAGACGIPVLVMQPVDSHMQDYRAEWCGLKSMLEYVERPDVGLVVNKIGEFLEQKTVLTTGCYDILHAGHVRHLEESRLLGTRLVVALNSDESARRLKGEGRPFQKQEDRKAVLEALRCVDEVRIFDADNALDIIRDIRPCVLTNGCDHKLAEVVGKEFVEQCGGVVAITGGERTVSTTRTIKRITGAEVIKACNDAAPLAVNPVGKLKLMADQFLSVQSVKGAIADLGAYRGGCSLVLKRLAQGKRLHVFDTWEGTPLDDPLCHHKPGEWKADFEECKLTVGEDVNTFFHKGVFPQSAESLNGEAFSFVYIDLDTYQSTKDAIEFFWPRLQKGGKMMLDDVDWPPCAGVKKALDESFRPGEFTVYGGEFAAVVVK